MTRNRPRMTPNPSSGISGLDSISRLGEKTYFDMQEKLEKKHMGEYFVLDVETGDHSIDSDKLKAIDKAKEKSGDKLFYIVQIGSVQKSFSSIRNGYAWSL